MKNHESWLKSQLQNQAVIDVTQRYSNKEITSIWQAWIHQLSTEKFYMPVFGIQGSGKSTLLNALFFDERVLPTDAQETTCIPAELHYSPELKGKAKVIYKDGSTSIVKASDSELAKYIDNVQNPGNEKKVSHIEVYSDDVMLEHGLVVVDLPGYGSLTRENEKTTLEYINKSNGAIHLIRSMPPLTRKEIFWLRNTLPLIPLTIFCQSCWDTDSSEEIEDAKDHNMTVLRSEIKKIRGENYETPDLLCVNGEGALRAKFLNNNDEFIQSGAALLKGSIKNYSTGWKELIISALSNEFNNQIKKALNRVKAKINNLNSSAEEINQIIESEKQMFEDYKARAIDKTNNARDMVDSFYQKMTSEINVMIEEGTMTFRNNMRTKFRIGIVDGERLNVAYKAEYSDLVEQIYYHVQDRIAEVYGELRAEMEDLTEWNETLNKVDTEFLIPKKTKYENIFPSISSAGGAIGGAALGAKAGAAVGASLGPVGAIIGTIVGGLIFGWLGRGAKNLKLDQRIKEVEPQVFSAITDATEALRLEVKTFIMKFAAEIKENIDSWLQTQNDNYDKQLKYNLEISQLNKEEKMKELSVLELDKDILKSILKELEAV